MKLRPVANAAGFLFNPNYYTIWTNERFTPILDRYIMLETINQLE